MKVRVKKRSVGIHFPKGDLNQTGNLPHDRFGNVNFQQLPFAKACRWQPHSPELFPTFRIRRDPSCLATMDHGVKTCYRNLMSISRTSVHIHTRNAEP